MSGCIYKITNLVNGKIYIGKTIKSLKVRFSEHISKSIHGGSVTYLHNAIRKYGKDKFIIEQIEECGCEEELKSREIFWIDMFKSTKGTIGYNLTLGGDGVSGLKQTEEAINKNREAHTGKKHTNCTRQMMSASHIGKPNMATRGAKHVNNGIVSKMVDENNLMSYLNNGWKLGRLCKTGQKNRGKIYINKDGNLKCVLKTELKKYILDGWEVGNPNMIKFNKSRKPTTANKVRMTKDGEIKYAAKDEIDYYEKTGWKRQGKNIRREE